MIKKAWVEAKKQIDPDYEGSLFQKLGFDALLCPECNAHLRSGLCLNNCHLEQTSGDQGTTESAPADPLSVPKAGDHNSFSYAPCHEEGQRPMRLDASVDDGYRLLDSVAYGDAAKICRNPVPGAGYASGGELYYRITQATKLFQTFMKGLLTK